MKRKLGHIQHSCLDSLNKKGFFHTVSFRNGWCWSSHGQTMRVFASLVNRGMVAFDGKQYTITQQGKDYLASTPAS